MEESANGEFCETPVLRNFEATFEINEEVFIENELAFVKSLYQRLRHPDDVFISLSRASLPTRRLLQEEPDIVFMRLQVECTTVQICRDTINDLEGIANTNDNRTENARTIISYKPEMFPASLQQSSAFGPDFDFPQDYPNKRPLWQRFAPFVAAIVGIFSVCCALGTIVYFDLCGVFCPRVSMVGPYGYSQTMQDDNVNSNEIPDVVYGYYVGETGPTVP